MDYLARAPARLARHLRAYERENARMRTASFVVALSACAGAVSIAAIGCGVDSSGDACSDSLVCPDAAQTDSSPDAKRETTADSAADRVEPTTGDSAVDGEVDGQVDAAEVDAHTDAGIDAGVDAAEAGPTCDSGTAIVCSGQCVDPSETANCGSCGNVCPPTDPVCQATSADGGAGGYACVTGCSPATPDLCGSTCVDTTTNPSHCNSCSNVCPGAANATATCVGSACGFTCNAGFHDCGGVCADDTSVNSCGTSCTACMPPASGMPTCSGGGCGFTCDPGTHACSGSCLPDTDDPSADACVVTDVFGVFVSPMGVDAGSCTKASPCKTIGYGIAHAGSKRTYVCGGTYAEQIDLGTSVDGAKVYGGLDCATWAYDATKKPVVMLTAPTGTAACPTCALVTESLATGALFEDFAFQAPNGVNAGDSSIAVFANASKNVVFKRVTVQAGNGIAGGSGTSGSNYPMLAQSDPRIAGNNANGALYGGTQACANVCVDGVHGTGGRGGGGDFAAPTSGSSGTPSLGGAAPNDGAGGAAQMGLTVCTAGDHGAEASTSMGGAGASTNGVLSASGWTPNSGVDGLVGGPGQGGGGGGGGISANTGGGGGGACGGCGGAQGTAGKGGGSSVALVSVASSITLDTCTLAAGNAGGGGKGGDGQVGQLGGFGGLQSPPGCPGGTGGTGGGGGGGGGGAGGLSLAVAFTGTAPTEANAVTKHFGTAGTAGAAGAGGGATAGAAGSAGPSMGF